MKPILIKLILSFVVSALFCQCSKEKLSPLDQLPPITSRGANTFGCLINEEPVVFTNPKQISYGLIGDYDTLGHQLQVDSFDIWLVFDNGVHNVNLFLNNPLSKTEWNLNKYTLSHPNQNSPEDYLMVDGIISSQNTKGIFISNSLRTTIPIFSGTFEFECINPKSCQTLKVTHGRLDVNLNELQ